VFVGAGGEGAMCLEFADAAFDDVALLVAFGLEAGSAPASAAAPGPVGDLVLWLGDGGLDLPVA
jgi:hypothetical protein